jgi:hypothetical protein
MSHYDAGKAQQSTIFAAKPDWTREQWLDAADEVQSQIDARLTEIEQLRGRRDAISLHVKYAKLPKEDR